MGEQISVLDQLTTNSAVVQTRMSSAATLRSSRRVKNLRIAWSKRKLHNTSFQ